MTSIYVPILATQVIFDMYIYIYQIVSVTKGWLAVVGGPY
jgi:hypothetical protein